MHYRRPMEIGHVDPRPICWTDERLHEAFMATPSIEDVTCSDCLEMYYATDNRVLPKRPKVYFDLWLDGEDLGESAGWRQHVLFDFDRFREDDRYAKIISDYISRGLTYLAEEVEAIGIALKRPQDGGDQ